MQVILLILAALVSLNFGIFVGRWYMYYQLRIEAGDTPEEAAEATEEYFSKQKQVDE